MRWKNRKGTEKVNRGGLDGSVDVLIFFFFFQAEDGIRDWSVTGVQTCALPIGTFSSYTRKHWNHPFLNREPLEPSAPKQKTIETTHF